MQFEPFVETRHKAFYVYRLCAKVHVAPVVPRIEPPKQLVAVVGNCIRHTQSELRPGVAPRCLAARLLGPIQASVDVLQAAVQCPFHKKLVGAELELESVGSDLQSITVLGRAGGTVWVAIPVGRLRDQALQRAPSTTAALSNAAHPFPNVVELQRKAGQAAG